MDIISLFVIFNLFFKSSLSLYFLVPQNGERCFFENVPEKALLSVSYDLISEEGKDCVLSISDNERRVLKNMKLDQDQAHSMLYSCLLHCLERLSFVSPSTGNYNICVHCPGRLWYMSQMCKISLNFEIADVSSGGDSSQYDVNYETTAKKQQVESLTSHLHHFIASANVIQEYQISENRNSTKLYDHYKSMNNWILVFYLLEILVVVLTSAFSVYHITRFFKTQCFI
ncbi:emp24/gp25L/p24 family/GOLD family protein [Theileria parva strain Muguga]|uniref:GOLD domain-containing protein n=1 Tax=Theileria parva TaxID=5875 RepID=Q4N8G5_THEPA|nr:emp24/gp25L/p24 family/GOLD family protein [Theileria parva strain Muguga]EAN33743.1 emp24/gp25L/p24 family/GOLD family protein [Theileria parva strain Muguga]|eukprot:XP_766026.1 hypothetical protein [Theileria parva strain Muguga]